MKLIIVEGMDSTGKSSLIEHLHSEFHVLQTVVNELGPEQDFDTWWPLTLNQGYHPYVPIFDRFFYSELVYGIEIRGYIKATIPAIRDTRAVLRRNALLIYARPPLSAIEATIHNKPQMEGVKERAYRLLKNYDVLMTGEAAFYIDRFIHYDWADGHAYVDRAVERYLG